MGNTLLALVFTIALITQFGMVAFASVENPFTMKSETDATYDEPTKTLTITGDVTIKNIDPATPTDNVIVINSATAITVTLDGLILRWVTARVPSMSQE